MMYRGMLLSDMPNLALCLGYTNASWTLKSDLTGDFICRVLNYMRKAGVSVATPRLEEGTIEEEPMMNLNSGYVLRSVGQFPKQGLRLPWRL